jgi:alpha-tubulin suppressor-like RCC1 family protein
MVVHDLDDLGVPHDLGIPQSQVPGLRNIPIRLVACGTCHAVAIDLNGQAFSWGAQQQPGGTGGSQIALIPEKS